jgi:hypothetical protein
LFCQFFAIFAGIPQCGAGAINTTKRDGNTTKRDGNTTKRDGNTTKRDGFLVESLCNLRKS